MRLYKLFVNKVDFFAMGLIILVAGIVRLYNLNYNSPFNDEAIYVVVGRLGIFQGDWWTYNAAAWMAGQPYIYPTLTAIAYMTGGIIGSRFLNVVFGLLAIETVYLLTLKISGSKFAGYIAAFLMAFSAVGIYVSRLATYDMSSFYFLFLSLLFLVRAFDEENPGKLYFLSSVFLLLALFTKIIVGLYVPVFIIYSFFKARAAGKENFHFWKLYFLSPILILVLGYSLGNANNLISYYKSQVVRESSGVSAILNTYLFNSADIWPFYLAGSLGLFLKKQWRIWAALTFCALLIPVFHLATHRWPTLDKHTFLSLIFLIPVVAVGLKNIIAQKPYLIAPAVSVLLIFYAFTSIGKINFYNHQWANDNKMLTYLSETTRPGDKILAEAGASAILVNYDKDYPTYTSTFDYFEYKHALGKPAYLAALKDAYFDTIELDGGDQTLGNIHSVMHNLVFGNIAGNYSLAYSDGDYRIFRRAQ